MSTFDNDRLLIAETLADLIYQLSDEELKWAVANARYELLCEESDLGCYKCSIVPPFSTGWACDICLEAELYELWRVGVHSISSCCGHGRVPPYIQVLAGESVQKMHELDYVQIQNDACPENPNPAFRPKTLLPCFTSCSECRRCRNSEEYGAKECAAEEYDIYLKWCFVPKEADT